MPDADSNPPPPPLPVKSVSATWIWIGYTGLLVMGTLLIYLVPRCGDVFKSVNVEMPAMTNLTVSLGLFLKGLGFLAPAIFIAMGIPVFFLQGKVTSGLLAGLIIAVIWLLDLLIAISVIVPVLSLLKGIGP